MGDSRHTLMPREAKLFTDVSTTLGAKARGGIEVAKRCVIKLTGCRLSESAFSDGNRRWEATDLVQYAKGLPVYKLPLKYLDLSVMPFAVKDIVSLANHIKRVNETSLVYPVIVGPNGNILDGWHRVVKALLAGQEFVTAVRLTTMPPASE